MFLIWSKSNKKKLIGKLDYFININGIICVGATLCGRPIVQLPQIVFFVETLHATSLRANTWVCPYGIAFYCFYGGGGILQFRFYNFENFFFQLNGFFLYFCSFLKNIGNKVLIFKVCYIDFHVQVSTHNARTSR